jgi:YfiH family protein
MKTDTSLLLHTTIGEGVVAFSTTRHGGCGSGAYETFNCTPYTGDELAVVHANQEKLCRYLDIPVERLVIPYQTHSCNILMVDDAFMQLSGDARHALLQDKDALITHLPEVCLCISTADCIPVLLYDREHKAIAAVHAGWRGTVGGIVQKTLTTMRQEYGTDMNDVLACIGPGISLESFEVGDEVYESFSKAGYDMNRIAKKYDKWHIDLWEANRIQLEEVGVKHANIETAGICTYKEYHDFFSARRLGIKSGRILSGIMLY